MYRAVEQHCNENVAILAEVKAFENAFNAFKPVIVSILGTEQLVGSPIAGITLGKGTSKQTLADMTSEIAGSLYAFADVTKDETLKQEANFSQTKLIQTRDDQLAPICQNIHDRCQTNIALLGDYGVTAAKLADLQTAINNYLVDVPKPRTALSIRKTQNANLAELFRQGDAILNEQMDKLVGAFRAAHPDFVATYESTRIIVDPASTATQLKGTVTKASDSSPIFNATITAATPAGVVPAVSKTTKSEADGKYRLKPIAPGTYDITITATGFVPFTDEATELKLGEITTIDADMEED